MIPILPQHNPYLLKGDNVTQRPNANYLDLTLKGSKYTNKTNNGESNEKENGKRNGNWGYIGVIYRDPSIQMTLTLGPKVCKYYLDWASWIFIECVQRM